MQQPRRFSLGDIIRKLNEDPKPDNLARVQRAADAVPAGGAAEPERPDDRKPVFAASPVRGTAGTAVADAPARPSAQGPDPTAGTRTADTDAPPMTEPRDEEQAFDIFRYLAVIMRRKAPIVIVTIAAGLYSLFSYMSGVKLYSARGRMLFRPGQQAIVNDNQVTWGYWIDRDKAINTHLVLLKSKVVCDRVSENLGRQLPAAVIMGGLMVGQGGGENTRNDIIEVTFKHPRAELARDVVNDVINTYIEYRREVNEQEKTRFLFNLQTQIDKFTKELGEKEDALRVFRENNKLVEMSSETDLTIHKLTNVELARQETEMALAEAEKRYFATKGQVTEQEALIIESLTFNNAYQTRLADLEMQLAALKAEYSAGHFKVRMVRQQIDSIRAAMKGDIEDRVTQQSSLSRDPFRMSLLQDLARSKIERAVMDTKLRVQKETIQNLNGDVLRLPAMTQRYANLQRETESLVQTLRMLKQKYEEAKIIRDSQESDLKILELAETPTVAVSSKKTSSVWIGLLVGLILGIAFAFLLEYLDQSVKGPADVEKLLEIPLIGYVPLIQTDKTLIEDSEKLAKSVIEPFRAVRANIKHLANKYETRTLMVCSAVKGEGKTTLAANLAITFALDGKSVVLVDGDLRRPQIHKLFNQSKEIGVADYLLNTADLDTIVKKTKYGNLTILTSGKQPDNPAELVGTVRFDELVSELRQRYDVVLFDSPALLPVSDVITMAPKMDGIIMVVRTFWTPVKAARQARNQLRRIGCSIFGAILNGVSHSRAYYPYYYGYYGYYGYYSYKYSYDYEKEPRKAFSMRELGLGIESRMKDGLQSARLYIPHFVALTAGFLRHLGRRPLFWLLLMALIGLAFLEVKIRPPKDADQQGIRLLDTDAAVAPVQTPAPVVAPLENAAQLVPAPVAVAPPDPVQTLKDSIALWCAAFNAGDTAGYLRFYDSTQFSFDGGTFAQWRQHMGGVLAAKGRRSGALIVDSVAFEAVKPPYCKTVVFSGAASARDTVRTAIVVMWKQNNGSWRIVRQKERE